MASPAHTHSSSSRYRRSSFNGAKQLQAARKPRTLMLLAIGVLLLALVVAVGTIAFHLAGG